MLGLNASMSSQGRDPCVHGGGEQPCQAVIPNTHFPQTRELSPPRKRKKISVKKGKKKGELPPKFSTIAAAPVARDA